MGVTYAAMEHQFTPPPEEHRGDHAKLGRYFDETLAAQKAGVEASTAQDLKGVRQALGRTRVAFCETAEGLSDVIKAVVSAQFGEPPGVPGPGICDPVP